MTSIKIGIYSCHFQTKLYLLKLKNNLRLKNQINFRIMRLGKKLGIFNGVCNGVCFL